MLGIFAAPICQIAMACLGTKRTVGGGHSNVRNGVASRLAGFGLEKRRLDVRLMA